MNIKRLAVLLTSAAGIWVLTALAQSAPPGKKIAPAPAVRPPGAVAEAAAKPAPVAAPAAEPLAAPAPAPDAPAAAPAPAPAAAPAAAPAIAPAPAPAAAPEAPTAPAAEAAATAPVEAEFIKLDKPAAPVTPSFQVQGSNNLISITLDDVEMLDVVRMFTRISGANIIATPSNLQGRVTVNLTDVEWRPALDSILDMHGLALQEKMPGSAVYTIVSRPAGAPEPLKVQTIFLKFATVSNAAPVVKAMLPPNGALSVYPSKNALVVRSTAANLSEISQVVQEIDIARDQVFIEAKFMELDDSAIKDLGINWQALQNYSVSAANMTWSVQNQKNWNDKRTDNLSRGDQRNKADSVNNLADLYNDRYEESTTTDRESPPGSGRYVTDTKITPTREVKDTINQSANVGTAVEQAFTKSISDIKTAVLGASDFQLILSALKQMSGVSVVSNPKIIVANEEAARIHIGNTERPFISSVTPGQQGIAPVVTYNPGDPVEFGVKLTVTPTVNTISNITVRIEPELIRFVKDAIAPNGQTYPIIARKTINTVFCLENGKTVAIGGLTETTDQDVSSKIPLLGDIPLIGKYLFSHTHKEKTQSETIIFVTVGLASPESIQKDTGLPEDTQLTRRHLIKADVERQQFQNDMQKAESEAQQAQENAAAKTQLLKRKK